MHLVVFLQNRPGILDLFSMLSESHAELVLGQSDADNHFKLIFSPNLSSDKANDGEEICITYPERLNSITDLPQFATRSLACCRWRITIHSVKDNPYTKSSLNLAIALTAKYDGVVYDPSEQTLIHPTYVVLKPLPALEELSWPEFQQAFKHHGQLYEIVIPADTKYDTEIIKSMIAIHPDLHLSYSPDSLDSNETVRSKQLTVQLDPADIASYADAAALITIMQKCAQHFQSSVRLIEYGDSQPILLVEQNGKMVFDKGAKH